MSWRLEPSLVRSLGSSPASRLMAWSLDRADLNPGTSAESPSTQPNPTRAVTLAAQDPTRQRHRFRLELGG